MKIIHAAAATLALTLGSAGQAQDAMTTETQMASEESAPVELEEVLVKGAEVVSADNMPLGTVVDVKDDNVVVKLDAMTDRPVAFLKTDFTVNEEGKVACVFTAEQIKSGIG